MSACETDSHGVERRPQHQSPRPERLGLGKVDRAHGCGVEGLLAHVSHHTDEGDPALAIVERDSLPERFPLLPELVGERAVDDSDGRRFGPVGLRAMERSSSRSEYLHSTISEIKRAPKPFLAAVDGVAAAGGFGIAMACDLVGFRAGFVRVGLIISWLL